MMNVLVVKTSSFGDILHTFPAVTDAMRSDPGVTIDWMVEDQFETVPTWHPAVRRVIPVAMRRWRRPPWIHSIPDAAGKLRRARADRYDLVIDAQGLMKSAVLASCCKGTRIGPGKGAVRESGALWFYHRRVSIDPNQHAIERNRDLLAGAIGYPRPLTEPDYGLHIRHQPDTHSPYLVFIHGSAWQSKRWPATYWKALSRMATNAGMGVRMPSGTVSEEAEGRSICSEIDGAEALSPGSLAELMELIRGARMVVSVDTGPGHLAAALGVPTVSIYGSTDASLTGLIGDHQAHLNVDMSCSPCRLRECRYPPENGISPKCYITVPPQEVWRTLGDFLKDKKKCQPTYS